MWFSGSSSPWKFQREVTLLSLLLLGLVSPVKAQDGKPAKGEVKKAPVLDDSPDTKPVEKSNPPVEVKRYSIPKHASSTTAARSMMEVPSPTITDGSAPERKPIVLTDKSGKTVDNLLFGFMTANREPLKDAELKGKARKATAELLFGNAPLNCWWDGNNLLNVEGTPLKVVFVRNVDGKPVDFEEKEEEPKIEKQFADQVQAIFYQPRVRDLNSLADGKKIFFGVTKNGFSITNQSDEKALQEKIYKVLQGEDVSALTSEENGVLRLGNDIIGVAFYYIEQVEGNTEVIEMKEPFRSNLTVALRQQNRKVLVVLREVERLRLVEVSKLKDQIKAQQARVEKGFAKGQKKEERIAELTSIAGTLPNLIASITKLQKNNEAASDIQLATELIQKVDKEEEALAFPVVIATPKECAGYELVQQKRAIWSLHHGTDKRKVGEWKTKPVWHNCNGDTFVLALVDSSDPNLPESHWEVFEKGEVSIKEPMSPEFLLTGAAFFKEDGLPQSIRLTVKDRTNVVTEYTPGHPKPKIRLLVGGEFDRVTKFRFWINGGNEVELVSREKGVDTSIMKFQTVDGTSFVGNSNHFIFKAKPSSTTDEPQSDRYFAVRDLELVDITAKLPTLQVARAQWLESRKVFRFDIEGDQVNHYEINSVDYKVVKRLSVAEECEKAYTFTVKPDQPDVVSIESVDAPKLALEVKKIKGIVCAGRRLAVLAEYLHSQDKSVILSGDKASGQLAAAPTEAESSGITLFILKANLGLVAYPALAGFNYSGISAVKDRGYQAKLKGPVEMTLQIGLDGEWLAPTKMGEPFSGDGMLVAQEGAGILLHQGQWVAATSKLTALSKHGAVVSMVADDLQLNSTSVQLPEGVSQENFSGTKKLATFDGLKLSAPFVAPLEADGETIDFAVLIKRGDTLWHRVWLKQNEDYGLLVSLDGHRQEAVKYRPYSGSPIVWER